MFAANNYFVQVYGPYYTAFQYCFNQVVCNNFARWTAKYSSWQIIFFTLRLTEVPFKLQATGLWHI